MPDIKLVHIGYPKCGSTFLQMEVFPKIKAVKAISTTGNDPFLLEAIPHIVAADSIYYDSEYVKSCFERINPETNIISFEGFAGSISLVKGVEIGTIASRLKHLVPSLKILVVLRDQKSIIPSLYMHDVKIGYSCGFDKWFKFFEHSSRYVFLKYSPFVECYQNIFGRANVKVVFFEELFRTETLAEILDFAGISSDGIEKVDCSYRMNPAYTPLTLSMTLWMNRHFGTKLNLGAGFAYGFWRYRLSKNFDSISKSIGGGKQNFINQQVAAKLYKWYGDDNIKLAGILGRKIPEGYL